MLDRAQQVTGIEGSRPPDFVPGVGIRVRLSPGLLIVPGSLLLSAVILLLGPITGPDEDANAFLLAALILAIVSALTFGWGRRAAAGVDEAGTLWIHYPGRERRVHLPGLVRVQVRPRRPPRKMPIPSWRLRLSDAAGGRASISPGIWNHDWLLFQAIAHHIHARGTDLEIDGLARQAVWSLAGMDPERAWEDPADLPAQPPPSYLLRVVVGVIVTLAAFWAPGLVSKLVAEPHACGQVRDLVEELGLAQRPALIGPRPAPDGSMTSSDDTWARLSPYLLLDAGPGYELFHAWGGGLEDTARARSDPGARDLFVEHGFRGSAQRMWHTPEGLRLEHVVVELSSARNAQSFEVQTALSTCRYANTAWQADLPDPAGRISQGLGLQVRHTATPVVEQISWTRGPRRHVVSIGLPGVPDHHGRIAELARRAAALDDGG